MSVPNPRWLPLGGAALLIAFVLLLRALGAPEAPGPSGWFVRWAHPLVWGLLAAAALAAWSQHRAARLLAALAILLYLVYGATHLAR